tara:strand:- start:38625 stop:39266 length:642 start_codon:yes stop_codon:yes gene_type:complete
MKKIALSTCFFLFTLSVFSQTKLYLYPQAEIYAKATETIAILPLRVQVNLRPKELKDFTPEQIVQMGKDESLDIQKGMHTWFLKRKQRGDLSSTVQNPAKTNALLLKAGYDIHNLDLLTPNELGQILGVDCVILGSLETSKPMSGAAALGALVIGFAGSTNSAICNLDFYNTQDEELVVNYYKTVRGGLGSNSQDLIHVLMRKVTRRIPYTFS